MTLQPIATGTVSTDVWAVSKQAQKVTKVLSFAQIAVTMIYCCSASLQRRRFNISFTMLKRLRPLCRTVGPWLQATISTQRLSSGHLLQEHLRCSQRRAWVLRDKHGDSKARQAFER